jgi:hypothetical protein
LSLLKDAQIPNEKIRVLTDESVDADLSLWAPEDAQGWKVVLGVSAGVCLFLGASAVLGAFGIIRLPDLEFLRAGPIAITLLGLCGIGLSGALLGGLLRLTRPSSRGRRPARRRSHVFVSVEAEDEGASAVANILEQTSGTGIHAAPGGRAS